MVMENGGLQTLFHAFTIDNRLDSVRFLWRVFLIASTSVDDHHMRRGSTRNAREAQSPSRLGVHQDACLE